MVAISITIEGQDGLTWPRWKRLITGVEALGFASLYCSDHFTNDEPPDQDALEMVVALTYWLIIVNALALVPWWHHFRFVTQRNLCDKLPH